MRANPRLNLALLLVSNTLFAQGFTPPRTEYGYPDFQGNWTNPWLTPLQRPTTLGDRQSYTADEVRALLDEVKSMETQRQAPVDPARDAPPKGGLLNQQADGNFETMPLVLARVNGEFRTSLTIDPANGRFPYRVDAEDIYQRWRKQGFGVYDGPEIRGPLDRCLTPGGPLPLMHSFGGTEGGNPGGDNPVRNIQIVQNKDYVVMLGEYFSMVRIIPVGREHGAGQGPKWMGDSIAWYEDDVLKIHSNQFRPEQSTGFLRHSEDLEVLESFELTADNELMFSYTVTDPQIYQASFTVEIPLQRMPRDQKLYEYACHEGNYSMTSILRGARVTEQSQ